MINYNQKRQEKSERQKIGTKNEGNKKKSVINIMVNINWTILVITLNTNDWNMPIEKKRLLDWIKKQDLTVCCL